MIYIVTVASVLGLFYGIYYALIALTGNLKPHTPIPHAKPVKRIAALIPARNEEQVIPFLVDSLFKQRYPRSLADVIVIANNCTDHTADAARRAGARVLECSEQVHSKGEVMRYAFALLKDEGYDAYCIFDADNVVDEGFFQAANDALCAGYEIAQSKRESKNPTDNWVAGCTSIFYWFMNRLYNRPRASIGMSASLNGTGVMLSRHLVDTLGFGVSTLTEDLEYTALCALSGHKLGWMESAITYDEQPVHLRDSFTQRRRWSAGALQCFNKYIARLLHCAVKNRSTACFDMAMLFSGMIAQLIGLVSSLGSIYLLFRKLVFTPESWPYVLYALVTSGIGMFLIGIVFALLVCILEKKLSKKMIPSVLMMGFYLLTWMPANLMCLFTRPPKWKQIPHVSQSSISEAQKSGADLDA